MVFISWQLEKIIFVILEGPNGPLGAFWLVLELKRGIFEHFPIKFYIFLLVKIYSHFIHTKYALLGIKCCPSAADNIYGANGKSLILKCLKTLKRTWSQWLHPHIRTKFLFSFYNICILKKILKFIFRFQDLLIIIMGQFCNVFTFCNVHTYTRLYPEEVAVKMATCRNFTSE